MRPVDDADTSVSSSAMVRPMNLSPAVLRQPTPHDPGAAHPHGLFTLDDVRRVGLPKDAARRRRRTGAWVRLRHNIYVTAERLHRAEGDERALHTLEAAAALFATRTEATVISHRSAAILHGLPLLHPWPKQVVVTVGRQRRGSLGHVEERTTRTPVPPDHLDHHEGLALTSVLRTAIDIAATSSRHEGIVVLDAALARRPASLRELQGITQARGQGPPSRALLTLLALADGRSPDPLTSLARLALIDHGVPVDGVAVALRGARQENPLMVPLLWPHQRVAAIHTDPRMSQRLNQLGITPITLNLHDVIYRAPEFAATIRGLLLGGQAAA